MTLTYQAIMGYKRNDIELPREGGCQHYKRKLGDLRFLKEALF